MKSREHGLCPHCNADMTDGLIYDTFIAQGYTPEEALKTAEAYGATQTTGHWGRRIGIYDMEKDRTVAWKCPDCGCEWDR